MTFHRALVVASVLVLALVTPAAAQFPPPPGQGASQASPFPPPPGQGASPSSPFPPSPGQGAGPPRQASPFPPPGGGFGPPPNRGVCDTFPPIRDEAEKRLLAIQAAGQRKATREEVCPLFKTFVTAEAKMVKFVETHRTTCNIPQEAVQQIRARHAQSIQARNNVCSAQAGPRGPSLSDAFSGPAIPSEPPKPGRGTFDTLTGSPLGR